MSQQRQPHMVNGNNQDQFHDTTFTKIFVGGLAWETQRETMRMYFEQFGEILEAVVITDKYTGRSKGYGFVTFKDPEAAIRACQNPSPIIDGRRANCNIASLGANKNRSLTLQHGRFRSPHGVVPSVPYHGSSSTIFHQPTRQYTFPYSAYGYSGYSQDTLYPGNYYNVYGVQQYSPYYPSSIGAAGAMGLVQNMYPFYNQYAQNIHGHGFGVQYPQMTQIPILPQHYGSQGILSLPSSVAMPNTIGATVTATATTTTTTIAAPVAVTKVGNSQASGTDSEQQHSTS